MGPRAIQITDEIYQVGGHGLTRPEDAAIYAIAAGDHAALIDAGCGAGGDLLLGNLESLSLPPERIEYLLLTHCHFDHTGGAAQLRERFDCRVVAHVLDAGYIESGDDEVTAATWYGSTLRPCVVDLKLVGARQEIRLGSRVIAAVHIPGHSPGSVAYVMSSQGQKVVFAQDVHGPLHPSLLSDRVDYQNSLQRLLDLEADVLCEGHYGVFRGKEAITRFIRQFMV
jgi:glyoxylase-like metal-dependent hydrolase (beta-lactamase superfamily II)